MLYGVLASSTNTGLDSELEYVFTAPLAIINNRPDYVQDPMNLKRKASSQNVQRWEIEANIAETYGSPSFLVHSSINGHSDIMYIRMPQVAGLELSGAGITVNGTFAAEIGTINISGASALKRGEFVQFSNDTKVFLVTAAGSGGNGIQIYPKLRIGVTSAVSIITGGSVTLNARYDDSIRIGVSFSDGILVSPGSTRFVEAT